MSIRGLRPKLRTMLLGVFLMGAAFGGMPIRPEEIEAHLQSASRSQAVQMLEARSQKGDDPPTPENGE